MEGWLSVPPSERNLNLIGRSSWKTRYVRFSDALLGPHSAAMPIHRASISTATLPRPVTASSGSTMDSVSTRRQTMERGHSSHQSVTTLSSGFDFNPVPTEWVLAVYKHKTDLEPLVAYPLDKIASCFVGDYATHKKKSVIQPTLIVNLRSEPPPVATYNTSRSFRRRSQEPSLRDSFKRECSGSQTLVFRPGPQGSCSLEQWSKIIQRQLAVRHAAKPQFSKPFGIDTFQDGSQEHAPELESPGRSPSSLFIVDGEPNTTLLSPSIRSKASNLSSVPSDDRECYSSPSPSPRFPSDHITEEEDDRPATSQTVVGNQSNTTSVKPTLHVATSQTPPSTETTVTANPPASNGPTPPRRETILDRFFSTAPETPASATGLPMSSIARFEALMEDLEKRKALQANGGSNNSMSSALISSPTARVLEFVSTGRRPPTPPRDHHNNWRDASPPPPIPALPRNIVSPFVVDRRNSDTMSMQSSYTSSTGTTDAGEVRSKLAPPGKRHSLADFSGIKTQQPKIAGGVIEEEEYESDDVEYVDESLREMPEYSYGNMKYRPDSEEDRRSRWRDIENHHSDEEEEDDYYDDTSEDEVYYGPQRSISAHQRPTAGSYEYHQQLKAPDRPLFREFSF